MSNINNIYRSGSNRVTGLASGLDVDALVKAAVTKQQSRLDKANQNKTTLLWKQESYRSVITKLTEFQSTYLDILNPKSVLRKSSMTAYSTSVSSDAQKYLKVSSAEGAAASTATVNGIKSIATPQVIKARPENKLSAPLSMTIKADNIGNFAGKSISVTLDGVTKDIKIGEAKDYLIDPDDENSGFSIDKFEADLQNKLNSQFGTVNGEPKIKIAPRDSSKDVLDESGKHLQSTLTFTVSGGSALKIASSSSSALGFTNNATNYIDTSASVAALFSGTRAAEDGSSANKLTTSNGKVSFTINGENFEFNASTSLKEIMNKVNASGAGVKMSYSTIDDSITVTSTKTGSGDNIVMKDNNGTNLLANLFGVNGDGSFGDKDKSTAGTDAVLTINNTEIVRSSNNFTIDGVNYELLAATPADFGNIAVETKIDSTQMIDTIKGFVEGYNKLIEELNSLLNEKANRDYQPLTDAQKEEMTEKQIENWEAEAKKGLLKNDPTISRMLTSLRSAFSTNVALADGGTKSFSSIGIKTSMDTSTNGKIVIDETKLKAAIEEDPESVIKMFTQTSDIAKGAEPSAVANLKDANGNPLYTTKEQVNNLRNSQMGVAQRFSEIFTNNINPLYNSEGALIKIAGTNGKNVLIDSASSLGIRLNDIEKTISKYQERLYADEDRLYAKYAALETALAKMQQQASYFQSDNSSS